MNVITRPSAGSVAETVERLEELIAARGLRLFAVLEHDVAAAEVGLQMRPTKVVVFGSPGSGTPLMMATPLLALDLPLKILVWEDDHGVTQVAHEDVGELRDRHGLTEEQAAPLRGVEKLAAAAAGDD